MKPHAKVTFRLHVGGTPDIPSDTEAVSITADPAKRDAVRKIFMTACELLFNRTMNGEDARRYRRTHTSFCELDSNHKGICMNFDPSSRIDDHAVMWIEHESKKEPAGGDDD